MKINVKLEIIRFDDRDVITTSSQEPAYIPKGMALSEFSNLQANFAALSSEVTEAGGNYSLTGGSGATAWAYGSAQNILDNKTLTGSTYTGIYRQRTYYYTWYDEIINSWRTEGLALESYGGSRMSEIQNYQPSSGKWITN